MNHKVVIEVGCDDCLMFSISFSVGLRGDVIAVVLIFFWDHSKISLLDGGLSSASVGSPCYSADPEGGMQPALPIPSSCNCALMVSSFS